MDSPPISRPCLIVQILCVQEPLQVEAQFVILSASQKDLREAAFPLSL